MLHDTNHKNILNNNHIQFPNAQIHLKKNWNIFLNLIFSEGSEEEISHFFDSLCDIQKNNFNITPKLKAFFNSALMSLIFLRKTEAFYFDFDNFLIFVNPENLLKAYKSKKEFPLSLKKKILNSLKMLDGFEDNAEKQNKSFLTNSNILNQQITNIFLNTSDINLNEDFLYFCEQITQKYKINQNSSITNLLINILYAGKVTPENKLLLKEHHESRPVFELSLNRPEEIIQNIISSLVDKNELKFQETVQNYIFYYIVHEKKQDSMDIDSLSAEDKIKLFFSPYVKKLNPSYDSFLSVMLSHFNEKIFNNFIQDYNLSINCPIRTEKDVIHSEEKDDKIYRKIIKKSFYYNIVEYCIEYGLISVADKLIKKYKQMCFLSFDLKIIENDIIHHYFYHFLKSHPLRNKTHLEILIKYNLVTDKTFLIYKDFNNNIVYENILFYLVYHQYYDILEKLSLKAKIENPFILTSNHKDNLVTFFLRTIFENLDDKKNTMDYEFMCHFIIDKKIPFDHQNEKGENTKDFLNAIGKLNLTHLSFLLELFSSVIPNEWKTENNKYSFSYEASPGNEIKIEDVKVSWFNRAKLEQHFEKISQQKDSSNIPLISYMLQNENHLRKNLFISNESIFEQMHDDFPNFKEVIDFYKGQFRIKRLSGKINIQPILLLGSPGIGKTYFAQKMAEYLKTGYTFLDLGSMTAKWILSGANGTWKDAKQGKILDSILNSTTINPIIVMDEIDKARGGDYDPTVVLYQLLEEVNSKDFTDEFIDFSFNSSGIIYIACANDAYKLSEPLLSRFKIFEINLPSDEQFSKIINNIYKNVISNTNIFSPILLSTVISLLKGKSMRNIKSNIQDAVNKAIIEIDLEKIDYLKKNNLLINLEPRHFKEGYAKPVIGF